MFGFASTPAKTRGQLMRDEMGVGWEHFLQAATHAANGVGASVGPATGKMRTVAARRMESTKSTLAPLAAAYREGAEDAMNAALKAKYRAKARKKENRMSRKKMGMLVGLLAAGAAVGAAGALVMRRRKQQQWSEYDPNQALESVRSDAKSMVNKAADATQSTIDKTSSQASRTMDKTADKLQSASSSVGRSKEEMKSKVDDMAESANDATDDFMSKMSSGKDSRS